MTTLTFKDKLIDSAVRVYREENPYESSLSKTNVIERIIINYIKNNGVENGKKERGAERGKGD